MENIAIEAKNISKSFSMQKKGLLNILQTVRSGNKKFFALKDISFKVPRGKMYAIIGLNGSGKTTLLRILAGIYKPDSGSVIINGKLTPMLHAGTGFNDEFVARENIIAAGIISGMKKSEITKKIDKIIEFAELEKFANQKLKHYSTGMKAKLSCATALEFESDILLMDEILARGDIQFKEKSFNAFLSFKNSGRTILFTSHSMGMVSKLADKVLLIHKGKFVTLGDPEEVISKYKEVITKKNE